MIKGWQLIPEWVERRERITKERKNRYVLRTAKVAWPSGIIIQDVEQKKLGSNDAALVDIDRLLAT